METRLNNFLPAWPVTPEARERAVVIAIVLVLHMAVLYPTMAQSQGGGKPAREMKVIIAMEDKPAAPSASAAPALVKAKPHADKPAIEPLPVDIPVRQPDEPAINPINPSPTPLEIETAEKIRLEQEAALAKAREEAEAAQRRVEQETAKAKAEQAAAQAKVQAEAKAKVETELARLQAMQEAKRVKAEQEAAEAKAQAESRARAEAEAVRLKAEQEAARVRAEHEAAQARAKADALARAETARLRAEQEAAQVRARAEAMARAEAEAARLKAEQEAARVRAEHDAALAKAKVEADTKARAAAEMARLNADQSEPSYKAFYHLKNASPSYPFAARRMGLQGKVILNVEVLADGSCGQVNVAQSSGHTMLDNNALETVRAWHFIPARQAGEAINKWFKVPIIFSLKDNET